MANDSSVCYQVKFSFDGEYSPANMVEYLDVNLANKFFDQMQPICREVTLTKVQKLRVSQKAFDTGLVMDYVKVRLPDGVTVITMPIEH